MWGGDSYTINMPNGYGASVVRHVHSYGYPDLWELAVISADGELTYETPITEDVVGHLDVASVNALLHEVASLSPMYTEDEIVEDLRVIHDNL